LSDPASDQKTIWLFREVLIRRGQVKKLFRRFEKHPNEAGLMGYEGKMIDASYVDVPRRETAVRTVHLGWGYPLPDL
jgi:hypothetical protein